MPNFPFNQPDGTRDCGYRCLYYVIGIDASLEDYETWLDQFKYFDPKKTGITFFDICTLLNYHHKTYKFTQLSEDGLFIVFSGEWLGPKHHGGHYFNYHNGIIYCSTVSEPYKMSLNEVVTKMESTDANRTFRCLKIQ